MIKIDLSQPSTWRGIVYLITGIGTFLGLPVDTETTLMIIASGLTVAGAIGFSVPDSTQIFEKNDKLK